MVCRLGATGVWLFLASCGESPPTEPTTHTNHDVRFVTISAGDDHTCGVTAQGRVLCWGGNEVGQIGTGTNSLNIQTPTSPAGDQVFRMVTTGAFHTCAVTPDSIAFCWGFNVTGQIGIGTIGKSRNVPSRVLGTTRYAEVAAGGGHTCGWTAAGDGFCWGARSDGTARIDSTTLSGYPVHVLGVHRFTQIATGGDHRCGLEDTGAAYCWGTGGQGRLGTGSDQGTSTPTLVIGGFTFSTLDAGDGHTCGLLSDGSGAVRCWGLNADGQLGTGDRVNVDHPVPLSGGIAFVTITLGGDHSCGLTDEGVAYCWGDDRFGQLGNGSRTDQLAPTPVAGGHRFTMIEAGRFHTCGITAVGQAYCWGFNQRSQLGDGTTRERLTPVPVASAANFTP